MQKYTIVLLRPDYIADPYGQDILVFHTEGETRSKAVWDAQCEALKYDTAQGNQPDHADDYAVVIAFEGDCQEAFRGNNY